MIFTSPYKIIGSLASLSFMVPLLLSQPAAAAAVGSVAAARNQTAAAYTDMELRGGPKLPVDGWMDIITDTSTKWSRFPLGEAPKSIGFCDVQVEFVKKWHSWPGIRRRITFNIPRPDIPREKVLRSVSCAWFMNIKRYRDKNAHCWGGWWNWQSWYDEKDQRWYIDFTDDPGLEGKRRAKCAIQHFIEMWGQWTGCYYDKDSCLADEDCW